MTAPERRAAEQGWRFVHPDLDDPQRRGEPAGLQLHQGGIQMVSGAALVRQSLLMLISTRPGERVMRPEYGCHLSRLMFAPNDDTTAGLAIHYVRQAVERWEPRAAVLHLDAGRDPDAPQVLRLTFQYRVRGTRQDDHLRFALNLGGEAGER
ncbi:GPW/gp25 family protein [Deinococcus radiopugnans]|uniref:GPW/gp25 family protein n=1 Tax=Deinococcus radiopugnans TaxID=57497 RepID=UPI0009DFA54D|nr:GPW/gp25 family protein [Deinococcus radiopugnans]